MIITHQHCNSCNKNFTLEQRGTWVDSKRCLDCGKIVSVKVHGEKCCNENYTEIENKFCPHCKSKDIYLIEDGFLVFVD